MISLRIELAISIAGQEPDPADFLAEAEIADVVLGAGEQLVYRVVSAWAPFGN